MFVSREIAKLRYQFCKSCDRFDSLLKRCKECNCFMPAKVAFTATSCPKLKWGQSSPSSDVDGPYTVED